MPKSTKAAGKPKAVKASKAKDATTTTRKIIPVMRTKAGPGMRKRLMTDDEVFSVYGSPGNTANFTQIIAPFPLVVAWDKTVTVHKVTCHKKIAIQLGNVLNELLGTYGLERLQNLRINSYGGLYNLRKMRGSSTRWSRHSWAIAIDLDPERNLLREDHTTARFARPEYKPMIEIFYKHGFVGLGPEKDYDWMHFEIGV